MSPPKTRISTLSIPKYKDDARKPGRIGRGAGEEVTSQTHIRVLQWELQIVTLFVSMLTLVTLNQTAEKG